MDINQSLLNENALADGIFRWLHSTRWPHDFHNAFYRELEARLEGEITPLLMDYLVDNLSSWTANRPKSKVFIYERGLAAVTDLNHQLQRIPPQTKVDKADWTTLEPLFTIAQRIKGVASPVFASKLCHFLRPAAYPVIDRSFTGIASSYADYWRRCHDLWAELDEMLRRKLMAKLTSHIPDPVVESYPWFTKIYELCVSKNIRRS